MTPDPYWPKLCAALGLDALADDASCATMAGRRAQGRELAAVIERAFLQDDLANWAAKLDAHGLIWAPRTELPEVIADPALRERGTFQPLETPNGTFETVGTPFVIRGADVRVRGMASEPGADTAATLSAAGLSEEEVAELAAKGVFG
jgi:crotonobetainyl-CoA:carnitine CoA-transferase CaiB-like acyl-CoA transferase